MTDTINKADLHNEDEIDLLELARLIWSKRKFVIRLVLVFFLIGLLIALFSKKEYTASTTFVLQSEEGSTKSSNLSSLAAMAGFNIDVGGSGGTLSPSVYPQVISSIPFRKELMNESYTFNDIDRPISLFEYYTAYYKPDVLSYLKKYTIGLPGIIIGLFRGGTEERENKEERKNDNIIHLTYQEANILNSIGAAVSIEHNEKEGYISLSARFSEAVLSAQLVQKSFDLLQQKITAYKIKKTKEELGFIKERYSENKRKLEEAQLRLARFDDRNQNVSSAVARIRYERLQNEYDLSFAVYSELAKQLEQARIKVKEDTPVFSVIQPVSVPLLKSKPNRLMIIAIWIFLGLVVSLGIIFGKEYVKNLKEKSK